MKKILLTTAAVAAISSSALALDMIENQFYLRGDVSGVMFSKFKTTPLINTPFNNSAEIKPKFGFGIDIGAGYYVMDNVRVELVYNKPFVTNMKGSVNLGQTKASPAPGAPGAPGATTTNVTLKHKPTINALLARVSGDVIDLGMGKIFLTGGLGWAQVKNSVTVTIVNNRAAGTAAGGPVVPAKSKSTSETLKLKAKNNLAWTLGAGAAFDVTDGVHLDVAYSYRSYGKTKSLKDEDTPKNFNSHNVSAGVRFDI